MEAYTGDRGEKFITIWDSEGKLLRDDDIGEEHYENANADEDVEVPLHGALLARPPGLHQLSAGRHRNFLLPPAPRSAV
jgi:hypothetical protein